MDAQLLRCEEGRERTRGDMEKWRDIMLLLGIEWIHFTLGADRV